MTARALARQYALALFDVAGTQGTVDAVGQEVESFDRLLTSNAELRTALTSTAVPAHRKSAALRALIDASGGISDPLRRLLLFMADRDRLALFHDVAIVYAERSRDVHRVARATITTASPLDEASRAALTRALGTAVGRRITLDEQVDPSIVGGVVARVGSTVFDASITRQLERLKLRLLADA